MNQSIAISISWRGAFTLFALILLAFTANTPATAQVLYGSVVGTVADASGGVVPNVSVTLKNNATGVVREATTDEQGRYSFTNVQEGTYDVTTKSQGFKQVTKQGLVVSNNQVARVDMNLEVGSISDQVTVSAEAQLLQTDKTDVSSTIGARAISDLPLGGYRNYQALLNLVPGTTPAMFQNAVTDTPARALTTNVNGTPRNNNATRVDGAVNVFIWLPHHTLYVSPTETIETMNVSTNNFDAEQGMAGGAAITVVTKSGGNDLHGVAFSYFDNDSLRARNFFLPASQQKPFSQTFIPGGTVSGPILKNKLFFFGGFEGTFEKTGFLGGPYTVPTALHRTGNFSDISSVIYDPTTGNAAGQGRTPFANNTVPTDRISATSKTLMGWLPLPNLPGYANNYVVTGVPTLDRYNWDLKINYNLNQKTMIWGKYSQMNATVKCKPAFGDLAQGTGLCSGGGSGVGSTVAKLLTFGTTVTITPTLLLDANFGWTKMNQEALPSDYGQNVGLDILKIPGTNGPTINYSGTPVFNISGYQGFGTVNGWQPLFRNDDSYVFGSNMNKLSGAHDLRWGFEGVHHAMNHWQPELDNPRGRFDFATGQTALSGGAAPTQYNAMAGFLLGQANDTGKSVQNLLMTTREWQWGMYFRDRWQVTRNLTLTLGVRYELYPLLTRQDRGMERWDQATNMVLVGGLGSVPEYVGITFRKNMFVPRVGFAYRLGGSTVIRAGYGMTNNPMPFSRPLRGEYPATISASFPALNSFSYNRTFTTGIPAIVSPDISTGMTPLPVSVSNRSPYAGELHRGYIQSWNFMIETKLPYQVMVQAGYVGTQTTNQFADNEINAAAPGAGVRPLFGPMGRNVSTRYWDGWLSGNYHSLQTSVTKPFSAGFMIRGSYTFGKAINMADDDGWVGLPLFNYAPAIARNRSVAGYDRTHSGSMGFSYILPFGKGQKIASGVNGAVDAFIGGWQLNGNMTIYSGLPFNVTAAGTSLNAPGNTQTADQILLDVAKPMLIGNGQPWFDRAAFRAVTEVRFGTTGRNVMRGPGLFNSDLTIFKNFQIKERMQLRFQAEAYNWTNTPKFANPNANIANANFGYVTSTLANYIGLDRQFRFGLRFSF